MICVENLKYKYPLSDKLALDDISFKVGDGEFIGIIGRNLSGKSTLCQALVGLVPHFYKGAYGGKVLIDDKEILTSEPGEIALKIGIVFQNPFTQATGSKLTVYEEIAFGLENIGIPREEMHERIENSLHLLNIYEYRKRNPFDLSGGQMQRVAIAGIIAMRPQSIVLDEPTSQLDPQGSEDVFRAIYELSKQGMSVVMVEHKMEKIAEYCSKVLVLKDGRQLAFDTPKKIFSRDDLEQLSIAAPVYTNACKALNIALKGTYPVTLRESAELLKPVWEKRNGR